MHQAAKIPQADTFPGRALFRVLSPLLRTLASQINSQMGRPLMHRLKPTRRNESLKSVPSATKPFKEKCGDEAITLSENDPITVLDHARFAGFSAGLAFFTGRDQRCETQHGHPTAKRMCPHLIGKE